jgi:hypothetical protein
MGEKQITNPAGAFGQTDLESTLFSIGAPFKASAAIVGPACVAIGTDGQVATAATNGTAHLAIGIAQRSIASGKAGNVVVLGICENVPAAGAVAAADLLKRSATTAGYVSATATPAAGEVIGIAINASASNTVDVWVCPSKVTS